MRRAFSMLLLLGIAMGFAPLPTLAVVCGDLNQDGVVNRDDSLTLRSALAGITPLSSGAAALCDVINDGVPGGCTMADSAVIERQGDSLPPSVAPLCAGASAIDPESAVVATSDCLTAGTNAQAAIVLTLVDPLGAPVVGADVEMLASGGTLGPVESSGNEYWATISSPSSNGGPLVVGLMANDTPLATMPMLEVADPLTTGFGGSGGCLADGNVRVRVVDENSLPLAGANVLIGELEIPDLYETIYREPPDGANTGLTDASGFVTFRDFGSALDASVTVTAAAANRQYLTFVAMDASDFVLPLRSIVPSVQTGWVTGDISPIPAPNNSPVEFGVAVPDVTIDAFTTLGLQAVLFDDQCYDAGGLIGSVALPGNFYVPTQCETFVLFVCLWRLPERNYTLRPLPYGPRLLFGLRGAVPEGALLDGSVFDDPFAHINAIGVTGLNVATPGPTNAGIGITQTLNANVDCSVSNAAPGSDVLCITGGDWDSASFPDMTPGEGRLFLTGVEIVNTTGLSSPILLNDVKSVPKAGAFTGIEYLGGAVSLYLDGATPSIPPGTAQGITGIINRSGAPYTGSGGTMTFSDFFPIRTLQRTGRQFSASPLAGSAHPISHFSRAAITQVVTETYTACDPDDSSRTSSRTLWEVYTPHSLDTWLLPTPPAGWPRANLVGDLAGLLDPTQTPENDTLTWQSQTFFEGIAPAFDYDAFRLFDVRSHTTHVTTNQLAY